MTTRIDIKEPIILPFFPLTSSAISGFLFCGIIEDPVARLSGKSIKSNPSETQKTISSENLER